MWLKITYEKTIHFVYVALIVAAPICFGQASRAHVGQIRKGSGDNWLGKSGSGGI